MSGLVGRLRDCVLRMLGVASRRDVLKVQGQLEKLLREFGRSTDLMEREARKRNRLSKRWQNTISRMAREQSAILEQIQTQLGSHKRGIDGRLRHVERNIHALIRRQYLDQSTLPVHQRVLSQRFHVLSQNEEDGITLALAKLAASSRKRFIELGAGPNGGNSGFLAANCGWTGLMVDGSEARAARLVKRFSRYGVHVTSTWITRDNVNDLVRDHDLAGEVDLLSLDIDGNDYWVWRALDVCSPRIVILEFNAAFGPDRAVTVQYDPAFARAAFKDVTRNFYGASLSAFEQLGREKGYRLVMGEPRGVNVYLLRNDVAPEIAALPVHAIFPDPGYDPKPLFDLIAKARLPLVELEAQLPEA